jgi:Coenzyme PQQ synthesis protein D (PqqD)
MDEVVVLIHLSTNRIYQLSPTGARVWELLQEGEEEGAIRDRLLEEFEVDDGTVDRELSSLLSHLISAELVVERARSVEGSE